MSTQAVSGDSDPTAAASTGASTKGLVPVDVVADDIRTGDRRDASGKVRYVTGMKRPDGRILWRIQTRGARGASIVEHAAGETVRVWRKPATSDTEGGRP